MLGVGTAFDMIAGTVAVDPSWMQRAGLDWVFRLAFEPRRLWRRYARHNARFAALVLWQHVRAVSFRRQSLL
jgi:N-acetylglucosaminyldiphosphoundecaprenol N-acetyl-beta-D-mannosaminyltransferase